MRSLWLVKDGKKIQHNAASIFYNRGEHFVTLNACHAGSDILGFGDRVQIVSRNADGYGHRVWKNCEVIHVTTIRDIHSYTIVGTNDPESL
tara:strand:+ start:240 stop:512 length:273 start_codon:yes stop_codon:yes gene_type:complete